MEVWGCKDLKAGHPEFELCSGGEGPDVRLYDMAIEARSCILRIRVQSTMLELLAGVALVHIRR